MQQEFKANPIAPFPKDSSESGRMADIILRLSVGDKFKNLLCEGVSLGVTNSAAIRASYSEELPELQRYPQVHSERTPPHTGA